MIHASVQFERQGFTLDVSVETDSHAFGLFGPSGAGKSTLISILAGLERPARGTIVIDGQTVFDSSAGIDVPPHRRRVGVVFQEHRLFPHLSVEGNLRYGAARGATSEHELRSIVELLELGPLLARRTHQLSGGERQRVALGRALASRPRALLMDEPLASLDERLKSQIAPYLQRIRDAATMPMLYVSHDLSEILRLTDVLAFIDRGRIVGQGRYLDVVHENAAYELVHDRGLQSVFSAAVVSDSEENGETVLQLGPVDDPSRRLIMPRCGAPRGEVVTVSVRPWDIALASEPVHEVSIQNQVRGTVTRCSTHSGGVLVEIDAGVSLIAEISARSAEALAVGPGRGVVCLIKSRAVRVIGRAPALASDPDATAHVVGAGS